MSTPKAIAHPEGRLQARLAARYGYRLKSEPSREVPKSIPVVADMRPLLMRPQIPASAEIAKVEAELKRIDNERKLMKIAQETQIQGSDEQTCKEAVAIKLMRQRIEEYNYIIDHKHITQPKQHKQSDRKDPRQYRKSLTLHNHSRNSQKEIMGQIVELQKKLAKTSLTATIALNDKIAGLFKQLNCLEDSYFSKPAAKHKQSLPSSDMDSRRESEGTHNPDESQLVVDGERIVESRMLSINEHSIKRNKQLQAMPTPMPDPSDTNKNPSNKLHAPDCFLQGYHFKSALVQGMVRKNKKMTRSVIAMHDQTLDKEGAKREATIEEDMKAPYINQTSMEQGRDIDKKIQYGHELADLWKHKIAEFVLTKHTHASSHKEQQSAANRHQAKEDSRFAANPKFKQPRDNPEDSPIPALLSKTLFKHTSPSTPTNRKAQMPSSSRVYEEMKSIPNPNSNEEKEQVLEKLLRKRNNKYNKITGTNIIKRYDARPDVEKLLNFHAIAREEKEFTSIAKPIPNLLTGSCKSEVEAKVAQWINEQHADESIYWTMCKNEKINLLIGHKPKP